MILTEDNFINLDVRESKFFIYNTEGELVAYKTFNTSNDPNINRYIWTLQDGLSKLPTDFNMQYLKYITGVTYQMNLIEQKDLLS